MNNFQGQHPGHDLLLLYFDGELPARRARPVEKHLAACWQCRAEVEEFRRTAADCVHYRNTLQAASRPPAPWRDLSRDFARIDAELPAAHPYRRWVPAAAAALLVAAGLFYHFRETPSVQAAALLRKAVAASEVRPVPHRHIRVRTKSRETSYDAAPDVRALFVKARYPAEDPLSARSYQQWRNAQAVKSDEVETITSAAPPFEPCYRIRTVAAEGDLATASLTLRTADLHPVEGRFEFRDQDWVELSEFTEAPGVETNVGAPVRRVVPSQPVQPVGAASISEELAVLTALHEIGADLGDPLEITRSPERILVSGVGIPPQRQRQIHQALDALPRVSVQFSDPVSSPLPQEQQPASGEASSPVTKPTGIEARLQQAWGGRAEFERISAQLLDWNDAAMSRVYALRALAQRFPADSESAMSAGDRAVLRDLARAHVAALSAKAASIEQALSPVLGAASVSAAPAAAPSWQAATEELYRAARRSDLLLTTLLGATRDHAAGAALPADLRSALGALRAETAACQRLLH
jgi:Putative zinc-finger